MNFSTETMQARREGHDTFKMLKEFKKKTVIKNILHGRNESKIETFSNKKKFRIPMAPHSSTLAWKIPWVEEPGRLQSMGSLGVRHD